MFCAANLTLKGKKSYQTIVTRVENAASYQWQKNRISLEEGFGYIMTDTQKQKKVIVNYDPFADVGGFMMMNLSSECRS